MAQRTYNSLDLINAAIDQSKVGPLRKKLLRSVLNGRPDVRAELLATVLEQCEEDCLTLGITIPIEGQPIEAVDWQKLVELFMKYLPTIIQLILSLL